VGGEAVSGHDGAVLRRAEERGELRVEGSRQCALFQAERKRADCAGASVVFRRAGQVDGGQVDGGQARVAQARRQCAVSDGGTGSRIDVAAPDGVDGVVLGCEANQALVRHPGPQRRLALDLSDDDAETRVGIGAEVAIGGESPGVVGPDDQPVGNGPDRAGEAHELPTLLGDEHSGVDVPVAGEQAGNQLGEGDLPNGHRADSRPPQNRRRDLDVTAHRGPIGIEPAEGRLIENGQDHRIRQPGRRTRSSAHPVTVA
jgi:hypothetical protein